MHPEEEIEGLKTLSSVHVWVPSAEEVAKGKSFEVSVSEGMVGWEFFIAIHRKTHIPQILAARPSDTKHYSIYGYDGSWIECDTLTGSIIRYFESLVKSPISAYDEVRRINPRVRRNKFTTLALLLFLQQYMGA